MAQFTNYLNYLYSNIYQNIPIFKHHVPPGQLLIYLWSPRLSYKYDTNMTQISYMKYAIRDHAGLPSIGLEKIYCCVPCKCAFYRLVYSQNSKLFSSTIRHNLPNFPAQPSVPRVDWLEMKCRSTNLKKFSKISRLLPQGREPRGAAPALPLSAMGKNSRQRPTPALVPPPQSPSKFTLSGRRRRDSLPGREGGNFTKTYMTVQFRSKIRQKFIK